MTPDPDFENVRMTIDEVKELERGEEFERLIEENARLATSAAESLDRKVECEEMRAELMRQWAIAHDWLCCCEEPDSAGCEWPVPIRHTMSELDAALADGNVWRRFPPLRDLRDGGDA